MIILEHHSSAYNGFGEDDTYVAFHCITHYLLVCCVVSSGEEKKTKKVRAGEKGKKELTIRWMLVVWCCWSSVSFDHRIAKRQTNKVRMKLKPRSTGNKYNKRGKSLFTLLLHIKGVWTLLEIPFFHSPAENFGMCQKLLVGISMPVKITYLHLQVNLNCVRIGWERNC